MRKLLINFVINCGKIEKFDMNDLFFDDVFVDRDEEMEVFDILLMVLLFEVVGIIGMCFIIIIGNGFLFVFSF